MTSCFDDVGKSCAEGESASLHKTKGDNVHQRERLTWRDARAHCKYSVELHICLKRERIRLRLSNAFRILSFEILKGALADDNFLFLM
jgi:hypothetical protein